MTILPQESGLKTKRKENKTKKTPKVSSVKNFSFHFFFIVTYSPLTTLPMSPPIPCSTCTPNSSKITFQYLVIWEKNKK